MDVISIDWEKGLLVCSYGGQAWISLLEHGDLLEYTGRKDKYKKEVYEGNIICEDDSLGGKTLEVFWDQTVSGFRCRRSVYQCNIPEAKTIEVIGNVSESPELLERN